MRVLIVLALVAAATATPLVGQQKCTWGPAYWCQHIKTAKECGAVRHCINVWKNNKVAAPASTEACLTCKGIISDLKALVAAKPTQDEIKSLALKACALMHNVKVAQEVCDTVVVMFLPEVIQMIESELDEAVICKALGLCSSSGLKKLVPVIKHVASKLKSSECDECKLGITLLKSYLTSNSTVQEIVNFLKTEVCPKLPGEFGTMCNTLVVSQVPTILKELDSLLNADTVCSMIGMCPKKINSRSVIRSLIAKLKPKNLKANPIECDLCEAGINDIRVELREPNTQKEVMNFLKTEVCTHLGSFQVTCSQAVDQYVPILFQLLISELDPSSICTSLGLCGNSTVKAAKMLRLTKPKTSLTYKYPKSSVTCVICEFVMSEVDKLIGTNRSEAAIQSALEKVCSILPSTIKAQCDDFVDKYTPLVVQLLAQYIQPEAVCKAIGLCSGETEPQNLIEVQMLPTCDLMMRYLRVLVKATKKEMPHALDIVCNFLPRQNRKVCRKVKTAYSAKILSLGKDGISSRTFHPKAFCKSSCKTQKTPKPDGLVHLLGDSECTYGPTFWCANYKNAAKCGAVQYCGQRVWRRRGNL